LISNRFWKSEYIDSASEMAHLTVFREELINRVSELVTDERKRLERQRIEEERYANGNNTPEHAAGETDGSVEGVASTDKAVPTGPAPEIDRGLCVVCQDEEATLAVVDCG
jgi:hypothetical protein